MLNSLIGWAAKFAFGKYVVAGIAKAHNALDGHRSEIALGILALVHALKLFGVIPGETADGIEKALAAILPITLADKVAKAKDFIDKVAPAPANDPVEQPKAE